MIRKIIFFFAIAFVLFASCVPTLNTKQFSQTSLPASFGNAASDTTNVPLIRWKDYFTDEYLNGLVTEALKNNQELSIVEQEILIAHNEVRLRKGEYLPFVSGQLGASLDKVGRYTRNGAVEENLNIVHDKPFPKPFSDLMAGIVTTWEVDVWKKLRNAKKSAALRYLATAEGRNFLITTLVAEIATSYYELMALDNILEIIEQNVKIQHDAYQIVKQEKESAKVTQLAVNRFEAQTLNTQNLQYEIKQRIVQLENRINFLLGRYPQPIYRNSKAFFEIYLKEMLAGMPSELLVNRPDIRAAELELQAAKLDVNVARANFYPAFRVTAGTGFQSFNTTYLFNPHSVLFNLAGDALVPLLNRNAIKAIYFNANAKQVQSLYRYEQTVLNAYLEVINQLAQVENYEKSYEVKKQEVEILTQSVDISNNLYRSARADYMEVLLTQREALNVKLELVEIKSKLLAAKVAIYKALGGGWN